MLGGLMFALKLTMSYMDPYREQRKEAKRQAALLKARLGRALVLNEYEQLLASSVLNPHHIDVALDDIGGLEAVKRDMVRGARGTAWLLKQGVGVVVVVC
jgi:hypothetical protein